MAGRELLEAHGRAAGEDELAVTMGQAGGGQVSHRPQDVVARAERRVAGGHLADCLLDGQQSRVTLEQQPQQRSLCPRVGARGTVIATVGGRSHDRHRARADVSARMLRALSRELRIG
jgi:hypothetical protein